MSHLRRPLAMLLAVLMCLSLFPASVFAEEPQTAGAEEEPAPAPAAEPEEEPEKKKRGLFGRKK